jgi:transglutaminase-like putative cysteine protease
VQSIPNGRDRNPPEEKDLSLYRDFSDKIRKLALKIEGGDKDPLKIAMKISQYLKTGFLYSLKLKSSGKDPIADFLFNDRAGNCEYFASAEALMLRSIGIPSRLVAGFRGGDYNPYGGYYILRGKNAHVWVEAWDMSAGWVPFDPTPPSLMGGSPKEMTWFKGIGDLIVVKWKRALGGYSHEKQLEFFRRLSQSSYRAVKRSLLPLSLFVPLLILGFLLKKRLDAIRKQRSFHS